MTITPAEARRLWCEALRSGEYVQGSGYLTEVTVQGDRDCCLGVACKVFVKCGGDLQVEHSIGAVSYDDHEELLPPKVQDWLGLATDDGEMEREYEDGEPTGPSSLVNANDSGVPFDKIAHLIESGRVNVVRDEIVDEGES